MDVWLKLIEAVTEGDCAKVVQLCQAHPCLTTRRDKAGNSLLHYVVVQRDTQFINKFLDVVEVDKTLKNHQGATPYDLWQEYERATLGLHEGLQDEVELLAESVMEGDLEWIRKGFDRGLSPRLYFFDDGLLVTLLHLGALYGQPKSISEVLGHVDDALFAELLTIQDSDGQTPLELAKELSQTEDPESTEVLRLLMERQCAVGANRNLHAPTRSLPSRRSVAMPRDYCDQLTKLDKKLAAGVTEADWPLVRDALPALCALSSTVCRQALQQPYSERQVLFLAQMSGEETNRLQGNLRIVTEFLEECLQEERVQTLFEFTTDTSLVKPNQIAACHRAKGRIYLNLTDKSISKLDLLLAVELFIHEMSHVASGVLSVDFCYKNTLWKTQEGKNISRNERKIILNSCVQLAKKAKYVPKQALQEEQISVIKVSGRLWLDSRQLPSPSRGYHLAARNADTIAVTALGLAAMALDQAETCTEVEFVANVNGEEARKEHYLLKISEDFLSEKGIREMLERYGATVHLAETPPPLTVFSSGTSPTKEQSLQPATTSKLAQAMASISDTLSSPKASSNTDSSTSGLLNGLLVANNRPN